MRISLGLEQISVSILSLYLLKIGEKQKLCILELSSPLLNASL